MAGGFRNPETRKSRLNPSGFGSIGRGMQIAVGVLLAGGETLHPDRLPNRCWASSRFPLVVHW
jgi:hypothetical protein